MRKRVLFVPVSSPSGMGEYARCLCLADAMVRNSPWVEVHFLLSREAPSASSCPYPYTLLSKSPTLSGEETAIAMRAQKPDLVVFDNAGRKRHLRAARDCGAAIVYISSRRRQRRRAFRLGWMSLISEHWMALPACIGPPLSLVERAKLRVHPRAPIVRGIDSILPAPDAAALQRLRSGFAVPSDTQVLVVAGGGGAHPFAPLAPLIYGEAAARIAAMGYRVVHAGSHSPFRQVEKNSATRVGQITPAQLRGLMEEASIVVTGAGDTLLQALALGKACVVAPIAHDQTARLSGLIGAVQTVELSVVAIAAAARMLLEDHHARLRLQAAATDLQLQDQCCNACELLLELLIGHPASLHTAAELTWSFADD